MGVGTVRDLIAAIDCGIDLFDSVYPTRCGRNGRAMTHDGELNLFNAAFVSDASPLDPRCDCSTCTTYTRAYLSHCFRAQRDAGTAAALVSQRLSRQRVDARSASRHRGRRMGRPSMLRGLAALSRRLKRSNDARAIGADRGMRPDRSPSSRYFQQRTHFSPSAGSSSELDDAIVASPLASLARNEVKLRNDERLAQVVAERARAACRRPASPPRRAALRNRAGLPTAATRARSARSCCQSRRSFSNAPTAMACGVERRVEDALRIAAQSPPAPLARPLRP